LIHHAVALELAQTDGAAATCHWERALSSGSLTPELAEVVPYYLAQFATAQDLARYEQLDAQSEGKTIWNDVVVLVRQQLASKGVLSDS
jgi:hypothetical protein